MNKQKIYAIVERGTNISHGMVTESLKISLEKMLPIFEFVEVNGVGSSMIDGKSGKIVTIRQYKGIGERSFNIPIDWSKDVPLATIIEVLKGA